MRNNLTHHIENWEKLLLDLGKRNKLINFLEGKRNCVKITLPSFDEVYDKIVAKERELTFPYASKLKISDSGEEIYEATIKGDIDTNRSFTDLQKTLKVLRYRAKTSTEEQGINTLYLTFGMLRWKEQDKSSEDICSPLILVPVKLLIESIISPYRLAPHDDEIVVNPTLSQKLENDFGIIIPEFDSSRESIADYLQGFYLRVGNKGWAIEKTVYLTNLSFLKINMYNDLRKNEEKLINNPIISTLTGISEEIEGKQIPEELINFDHDKKIHPRDTFQVLDADSSQQDAILLSKKGISFVLQGPPGTGKSQTITNIIAEAIADGKKVLFVSEKMAALQVVYNRLVSTGLGDFCLTLHSHKTKPKEILKNIASSINAPHSRVRQDTLATLDFLEEKRKLLNDYKEQLHTKTSGLNTSIYTVNGKLAKLANVPDVNFPVLDVRIAEESLLNKRLHLLNELSKTIGERGVDYSNNVWRETSIDCITNTLRHDIDSNITQAIVLLESLKKLHLSACSRLDLKFRPSLKENTSLSEILSFIGHSPVMPIDWIKGDNAISTLLENATAHKNLVGEIVRQTRELEACFNSQISNVNAERFKDRLQEIANCLKTKITGCETNILLSTVEDTYEKLIATTNTIDSVFKSAQVLASKLGIPPPVNANEILLFIKSVQALHSILEIRPTLKWFDLSWSAHIEDEIENPKNLHQAIIDTRTSILTHFDCEILDWNPYPMLQRFRGEYASIFRIFKRKYYSDRKQISSFSKKTAKISYKDGLDILNILKTHSDDLSSLTKSERSNKENYGIYYKGTNTCWETICNHIKTFHRSISQINLITPQLEDLILQGNLPTDAIIDFIKLSQSCDINGELYLLSSALTYCFDETTQWRDIRLASEASCSAAKEFICLYKKLMEMRKTPCDYNTAITDLERSILLSKLLEELSKQESTIRNLYKNYYNGIKTDWDKLINALKYTNSFKEIASAHNFSESLIKDACENSDLISFCMHTSQAMLKCRESLNGYVDWYASLFKNKGDFLDYDFSDLIEKMSACRDNKHLLEEWIDYCSIKKKCSEAGLCDYLEKIEEFSISPNHIVNAYLKRFYRAWLDAVLPNFPMIQNFRAKKQTQDIYDFCKLDKESFKIAQTRIRALALSRIPDFNSVCKAHDEITILKRELNKQRRLLPLRKLFMAIPNLMTSLRPCFMMSPLSVSMFLDAQSYNFDLVIFDEASQIHTEDAIGAIMRSKQAIIVGDTKQLPPTSFFSTSTDNDEYDVDSEENSAPLASGSYESILAEASVNLPERSLRWHYRSRHEHLIAFSNIKIYNNNLITFPSPEESAQGFGVEYVHVKNGIYDRGGKKNNIVEAQKVADLVFEHFEKYPTRSLGIVTFSESQQDAVDTAIRKKRIQHPEFDDFFKEDKEEAFFIKNLENVQGDERDTIIFSIGYAKDSNGIMHMNFGPLSRTGGYRRLNVAITRAKYNIKLVGSIFPADIDLNKITSDGVKMLRSYIEFAQQGIESLEKESSFSNDLEFDSPFEEAVYDFLRSKGYDVATQVGCSGFRIDMAVKHPTVTGKFIIGIECDGATYHSSRTARDRDRLRQTVLEDMGWIIYRIWSTDWIKNQKTEEGKLIDAIEKALIQANRNFTEENDPASPITSSAPPLYASNQSSESNSPKKSPQEIAECYLKSAEQGDARSQNNLGECYYYGDGVERDLKKAVKWYRKAANQGNAEAQYSLGHCYEYGEGIRKSTKEAIKWYQKSAEQGDEDAKQALAEITN